MEIRTLEGVSKEEILEVFNASFSDYFIPFKLSVEQLTSKMLADNTNLSFSVGVFENGKIIAFILHGFDTIDNENIVYNGGTGVIPDKRGNGLTKKMYRFILPVLEKRGVHKLILEVISNNIQAIKSYEASGFIVKRELLCYKGDITIQKTNSNLKIKPIESYNWEVMTSFWDIYPTWQNAPSALSAQKEHHMSLAAYIEHQLIGYLIFNPANNRIQQLAVDKKFRRNGVASTLCHELIISYGNKLSIINVDSRFKPIHTFFERLGFQLNLKQLEMELQLL